jgi:hypothetical protein
MILHFEPPPPLIAVFRIWLYSGFGYARKCIENLDTCIQDLDTYSESGYVYSKSGYVEHCIGKVDTCIQKMDTFRARVAFFFQ